jgi:malonate decarboxylase delta subunit
MEKLSFEYSTSGRKPKRNHAGVVGSGDLEILLEPSADSKGHVTILTSVAGFERTWQEVLNRFFESYDEAATLTIHDSGATPGTVALRLQQAVEGSRS